MTGYIILDTETNALPDWSLPAEDPRNPRLAELAFILATESLDIEARYQAYVRPDQWEMSDGATEANGLTMKLLEEHGRPIGEVLDRYVDGLQGRVAVAFDARFDLKIMRGELRRAGRPDLFEQTPNVCVMQALRRTVNPSNKKGGGTLAACMKYFDLPYEGQLGAVRDSHAAYLLFLKAKAIGVLPEPKVYYAKEPPQGKLL